MLFAQIVVRKIGLYTVHNVLAIARSFDIDFCLHFLCIQMQ